MTTGAVYAEAFQNEKFVSLDELPFEKEEGLSTIQTINASAIAVIVGANCELKEQKKLQIVVTVVRGQMQLWLEKEDKIGEKEEMGKAKAIPALPRKGRARFPVNLKLLISSNSALLDFEEARFINSAGFSHSGVNIVIHIA